MWLVRKEKWQGHTAYCIVALTPINAEVKLVDIVNDPSIFDRLCQCYPEIPNTSWTGCRKTRRQKSKHCAGKSVSHTPPELRMTGLVTHAMARRLQDKD